MMKTARQRDDEAVGWAIRLAAHSNDAKLAAAADDWLAADSLHIGALLRAQAALSYLDRGRALGASPQSADFSLRRKLLAGGCCAVGLAAGFGGFYEWEHSTQRYRTHLGDIRSVGLSDGSQLVINTMSSVEVHFAPERRTVRILDGQAWFQVAHDARRPFVVHVGDVRVQAIGTAFMVRRHDDGAEVLVTDGVVDTWVTAGGGERARLRAGLHALVNVSQPIQPVTVTPVDMDRSLAWRTGEIALDQETLAEAAADFNRYNSLKLIVEDPDLASERVVGRFRTNRPLDFAKAAATMLNARYESDGKVLRIVR